MDEFYVAYRAAGRTPAGARGSEPTFVPAAEPVEPAAGPLTAAPAGPATAPAVPPEPITLRGLPLSPGWHEQQAALYTTAIGLVQLLPPRGVIPVHMAADAIAPLHRPALLEGLVCNFRREVRRRLDAAQLRLDALHERARA